MLADLLLIILASLSAVIFFFWFFHRYFIFDRPWVYLSRAFFLGLLGGPLAILIQHWLPEFENFAVQALIEAALVEETIKLILLYFVIRRPTPGFTVIEGIFSGVLISLGFAFGENILYGIESQHGFYLILLRNVSSVPMHVFAAGVMGYYLSYRSLAYRRNRSTLSLFFDARNMAAIKALLIPVIYHGIYDALLFGGGNWNFALSLHPVVGFLFLEGLIAYAQRIPGKNILDMLEIDIEGIEIIYHQRDIESWMNDIQSSKVMPRLMQSRWRLDHTVVGVGLFIVGAVAWLFRSTIATAIRTPVPEEVRLTLFTGIPWTIAFILMISDKVNFRYFSEQLMRIPMLLPGTVTMISERASASEKSADPEVAYAMDLFPMGFFISSSIRASVGDRVQFAIRPPWSQETTRIDSEVMWANSWNPDFPVGVLCMLQRAGIRYFSLRQRFRMARLKKRFIFFILSRQKPDTPI